eukprot:5298977-Prymnesium_polylepis.1
MSGGPDTLVPLKMLRSSSGCASCQVQPKAILTPSAACAPLNWQAHAPKHVPWLPSARSRIARSLPAPHTSFSWSRARLSDSSSASANAQCRETESPKNHTVRFDRQRMYFERRPFMSLCLSVERLTRGGDVNDARQPGWLAVMFIGSQRRH